MFLTSYGVSSRFFFSISFYRLLSLEYLVVIAYCIFVIGTDLVRSFVGPLPEIVCDLHITLKNSLIMTWIFLNIVLVAFKYFIVCLWKSMPSLNDVCISRSVLICSVIISIFLSSTITLSTRKPSLGKIICSGFYDPKSEEMSKRFPILEIVTACAFFIHLMASWKIQLERKQNNEATLCTSIESLTQNLMNTGILLLASITTWRANRIDPTTLDEKWGIPFFNYFILPSIFVLIIVTQVLVRNGQSMRKQLWPVSLQPIIE